MDVLAQTVEISYRGALVDGQLVTLPVLEPMSTYVGLPLTAQHQRYDNTQVLGVVGDAINIARHYATTQNVGLVNPGTTEVLLRSNLYRALHDAHITTLEEDRVYVAPKITFFRAEAALNYAFESPVTMKVVSTAPAGTEPDRTLGALGDVDVVVVMLPERNPALEEFLRHHLGYFALVLLVGTEPGLAEVNFGAMPTRRLAAPPTLPTIPRSPRHALAAGRVYERLTTQYPGLLREVQHWATVGDWATFEGRHNFIQILFPGMHAGMANTDLVLSHDDVERLKRNPVFLEQAQKAFTAMMLFYGLHYDGTRLTVVDQDRYYRYFILGGAGGHNYLRITRILTFLRLMELYPPYIALREAIQEAVQRHPGMIPATTLAFWNETS